MCSDGVSTDEPRSMSSYSNISYSIRDVGEPLANSNFEVSPQDTNFRDFGYNENKVNNACFDSGMKNKCQEQPWEKAINKPQAGYPTRMSAAGTSSPEQYCDCFLNESNLATQPQAWTMNQPQQQYYPEYNYRRQPPNSYQNTTNKNPMRHEKQRPTILLIVVNKSFPDGNNSSGTNPRGSYPTGTNPRGSNYSGNCQETNPIYGYQQACSAAESDNASDECSDSQTHPNNQQVPCDGSNYQGPRVSYNLGPQNGSDPSQTCDPFVVLGAGNDDPDGSQLGGLQKTLENIIPNEECLYYLSTLANKYKKKKKKKKPRSNLWDRCTHPPPFVIEPKTYCMNCCNRPCCYRCCDGRSGCGHCCSSCNPWY